MNNLELLFKENTGIYNKIKIQNKAIFVEMNSKDCFDLYIIKDLIKVIQTIRKKFHSMKLPVYLFFDNYCFEDKLCYVLTECVCYNITKERSLKIGYRKRKSNITTSGLDCSPMNILCDFGKQININKFKSKFELDIFRDHFRKIIKGDIFLGTDELSKLYSDVSNFLNYYNIDEQSKQNIAEVIVELVGNAVEHTKSDCLIDIDVGNNYFKSNEPGVFNGVNIVILNFSEKLFGDSLKEKIQKDDSLKDRYQSVLNAYNYHNKSFDNEYTINDFFNLTAFQHKISGRTSTTITGGTGLTKLIHSLEQRSDTHNCYMISGNRKFLFENKYLEYNKDGWIGFNESNVFINQIPDKRVFCKIPFFYPGTAYNLNFVLKEI